jgi:hypothetical protein
MRAMGQIAQTVAKIKSIYEGPGEERVHPQGTQPFTDTCLRLAQELGRLHRTMSDFSPEDEDAADVENLSRSFLSLAEYVETGKQEAVLRACRQLFAANEPAGGEVCALWIRRLSLEPLEGRLTPEERRFSLENLRGFTKGMLGMLTTTG